MINLVRFLRIIFGFVLALLSFYFIIKPIIRYLLIKRYYNSGAYERDVEKICEEAIAYFSHIPVKEDSLIIFDVDDTAVYNLDFRGIITGLIVPDTKAILPVLKLYKYLVGRGFKIIFLTGRNTCDETKKELIDVGYIKFEDIICMPVFDDNLAAGWKLEQRKKLSHKYTIVGTIADRDKDFFDGYNGHMVKLPNYLY